MSVDYIKFIECKDDGTEFSDGTHVVSYSFTRAGESKPTTVESGVSPLDNGTYTVTNQKREPTKLTVTKKWKDRPEDDKDVYVRLFLIGEKSGEHAIIYPNDFSAGNTAPQKLEMVVPEGTDLKEYWANESYSTILHLQYDKDKPGDWNQVTILIPAGYKVDGTDDNYVAGVYAVELDGADNGSAKQLEREGLRIAYSYTGKDGNVVTGVSKDNPAPAGEGTLTIRNAPPGNDITLKKLWKNGDDSATADAPDSVQEIKVQLWKQAEGEEPERITEPDEIVLDHSNRFTYSAAFGAVEENTAYYAQEVSVTYLDADGNTVPVNDSDEITRDWFIGDQGPIPNAIRLETTDMTGQGDINLSGDLTNKPRAEETTDLSFTKAWYNKDGSQRTAAEGETINVKLWSKTAETTPTQVTGLDTFTPENLTNLTVDTGKDELVLAFTGGVWPTGKVSGLPRYRNGELVEYYVEEVSTSKDDTLYYGVTYKKGESPAVSDPDKAGTHDDTITVINTVKDRSLKVEKKWDDSLSHAAEEVTVELYRWKEGDTFTPPTGGKHYDENAPAYEVDPNTMLLNVVLNDSGLESHDGWSFSLIIDPGWSTVLDAKKTNTVREGQKSDLVADQTYTFHISYPKVYGVTKPDCHIFLDGDEKFTSHDEYSSVSFPIKAVSGEHTLYINFTGDTPPGPAAVVPSGHITIDAVPTGTSVESVPASADIKNPVTLNKDVPGWTYRWDKLPGDDGLGHKYHYAVVETLLDETGALKDSVSYVYHYDDDTDPRTLDPTKYVTGVTITNKPEYPTPPQTELTIYKVDNLNRETILTGAKFKLTKPDNTYQEQTLEDGHWKLTGLVPGKYTLKEIEAPTGYVTLDDEITFTVGADNTITTNGDLSFVHYEGGILTVGNRQGAELPSTGGVGVEAYRIGGAALLLAATGLAAAEPLKRSRADRARRRKGGEGET